MKSYKVIATVINYETNQFEVVKEIVQDDDTVVYNLHTFGIETPEHYAAIYDLDNVVDAVDMVIHEPFVGDVDTFKKSPAEARQAFRGKMAEAKLKNAKSDGKGKSDSKSRMSARGIDAKYQFAVDAQDPMQLLYDASPFNPEVIRLRKEFYAKHREMVAKSNRPVESRQGDQARIAEAKKLLQGPHRASARDAAAQTLQRKTKPQVRNAKVSLRRGQKPEHS